MKFQAFTVVLGMVGGMIVLPTTAQAFSFTTNFTLEGDETRGDITLNSVTLDDGSVIDDFLLVNQANILENDLHTDGNTGAASSDHGDFATGVQQEVATNESVVESLGNRNLNSIIDTEDHGSFKINLFFESVVDRLFVWERGMNSTLGIQAIDADGNLLGNLLDLTANNAEFAGYRINTTEIGGAQRVGSFGVSLDDLGVTSPIAGVQVVARGRQDNGPDFTLAGSNSTDIPEPATLLGLGLVAGSLAVSRHRRANA
jgi:hypothetical protein